MIIVTENYNEIMDSYPINLREVNRYCGGNNEEQINAIIYECINELSNLLSYKVCYTECDITVKDNCVGFPFAEIKSADLSKNLKDFNRAVIFSATIGFEIDRFIKKYSAISPLKAVIFSAIGAERIEQLCDVFNEKIKQQYIKTNPRFSPGYGDFPLDFQKEIVKNLQCGKNIGVTLNESLLMSPSKSVTAIIGVKK